ncbi:MAG TPA: chemotaxis protein CheX [Spirochaetales bacterium]|nr:chemotaxis protein CheX [Spirochaetales bacterium]HRY55144.1 chemotaxis protein CheX [Spirochaetia bacterium]HRZ66328.1 chemotaxis protein CheX [Spirochaetia bacterium]
MNVSYVNPFLEATINLFERTFGISPQAGEPYLDERAHKHRWEISAVMVLTGNAIGVVVIRLTRLLSDKLLVKSGVQWASEDERESLISAMVAEMINIVSGNASAKLTEYDIEISVPLVVQGENHTISWPERAPIIGIPFTTPLGPFLVDVCLIELPKAYQKPRT